MLGHRGARHAAPENTLVAFELSRVEGADGIELDVRLDGSGEVIVLHDPELRRVTRGADTRHAEDIPSRELSRLDVGNGARVPTLSEVLSWAREHEQRVNVELKSDVRNRALLLRQVERVVSRQRLPELLFSSFHPYFVWWLARRLPELPPRLVGARKAARFEVRPRAAAAGANALHPEHVLASSARVARLKRAHFLVNTWTVNEPARARELARIGVDAIISDVPGKILAELADLASP